ncbi:MAG: Rpn family recombination-promoting nuclease/putative transposase [Treponema sp.]|nr:Rpn family recombination-promoting nuclease/putative transposase [Treponema sp.]
MADIHFDDHDDLIDICKDNVFKAVFTRDTPESQGALSKLLSAIIGRSLVVTTLTANEPPIDNIRDRQIRFDIKCKAENGELVNVEMSLNPDAFEPLRLEFYAGKLFTGQDIRGADKEYDDLKQTYQIAFLVKERFFPDDDFFHTFEYYDPARKVSLGGRSRIITLELSKLEPIVAKPSEAMTAPEHWAVFFRYLDDKTKRQKINEIVQLEEGISMASAVLMTISKDEVERARLESEYKYVVDTQSKVVHAKREGVREVAKKALAKGSTPEFVAGITGLSLDEIGQL